MQGKVEISGVNTAKLRTLSNDEMMALIDRAQSGDDCLSFTMNISVA